VPSHSPGQPPLCDLCHAAPAAIQFVEQRGNERKQISICQACAAKQGIHHDGSNFTVNIPSVIAALTGLAAAQSVQQAVGPEPVCRHCGMTAAELREGGRVGCSHCYEAFESILAPFIHRAQAGTFHKGLAPRRLAPSPDKVDVAALRLQLRDAVKSERYEEAAKLRDRIRELEKKA
jgi:protein arginine kinase activator